MSDFANRQIEALVHAAEPMLSSHSSEDILGHELAELAFPLTSKRDAPITALLRLALLNDCMRVAERVIMADGHTSDVEVDYLYPLLRHFAPLLGRLRGSYAEYERLAPAQARDLLDQHALDGQPFGGNSPHTEWSGCEACRRLTALTGSSEPLHRYAAMISRLIDEVAAHREQTEADQRVSKELRALVRMQTKIEDTVFEADSGRDLCGPAFCSPNSRDVFHAISHSEEIWDPDPFDVDAVHAEARQRFDWTLDAVHDASSAYGRSLVVLGDSGAGKTHLLRAFRSTAHASWRAFTGYVQLNVETNDYAKLLVRRLVDSMDRPYNPPRVTDSGLAVLSEQLVRRIGSDDDRIQRLRDADLTPDELSFLTNELASTGCQRGLNELHVDLVRAFLLLQRRDPALRQRVLKLLRCEYLSKHEQELIGDIAPWTDDTSPHRMLVQLGKLAWEANGAALLLLLDQIEDLQQHGDPTARFRRVADTIRSVTDELPHCLIVLASLQDFLICRPRS